MVTYSCIMSDCGINDTGGNYRASGGDCYQCIMSDCGINAIAGN